MNFSEVSIRILVRNNYGKCFDFYTQKMGLVPVWGNRNGPYTSFAVNEKSKPCFAIFNGENMSMFQGYKQPTNNNQPDTIVAVIPTNNINEEYLRLKDAGVVFLGKPQYVKDWGMHCVYFRDPEGNLFELMDSNI